MNNTIKPTSKPIHPVDLDSGQRRQLDSLIDSLRKEISTKPEELKEEGNLEDEGTKASHSRLRWTGLSLRRRAGAFSRGLRGQIEGIPA